MKYSIERGIGLEFSKRFLKWANSFLTAIIVFALAVSGIYAGYCLWDNYRVYSEAENVQEDMLEFKPDIENETAGEVKADFDEMRKVNPDICAWLTIDNTEIDYPILQGENNLSYINTDVYGNFSLAGSIFLDTRCSRDFTDQYSLVYGHHMASSRMFGDLDKFKDEKFFKENKTGTLILPDKIYKLEIFSVLVVGDSESMVFNPSSITDINTLLTFAQNKSLYLDKDKLGDMFMSGTKPQVLAMSTCSSEFTDARTVVLANMVRFK